MRIPYLLAAALTFAMLPGRAAAQNCPDCPPPAGDRAGMGGAGYGTEGTGDGRGGAGFEDDEDVDREGQGGTGYDDPADRGFDREGRGGAGADDRDADREWDGDRDGRGGAGYGERDRDRDDGRGGAMIDDRDDRVVILDDDREDRRRERESAPNEGLTLAARGGVEGYTGSLAPRNSAGPSWGVTLGAQPTSVFGLEVGYQGARNDIDDPAAEGGRINRNGGNVNVKISLAPRSVEPYVFGGVGISRANVTGEPGAGYQSDTFGQVPVGAGLNLHLGAFTAGARVAYEILFNRDFAPAEGGLGDVGGAQLGGDIWNGQLQLGATF
jgi:hypothetical protein